MSNARTWFSRLRQLKVSPGMIIRLVTDFFLVHLAIITSLAARFTFIVLFQNPDGAVDLGERYDFYLRAYTQFSLPLSGVCLIVFFFSGFYTYGRFYQGKYKLLAVIHAVTLAYLLYGFLAYFIRGELGLPRGALLAAYFFTVALLAGARLFSQVWDSFVRPEREQAARRANDDRPQRILVIGGAGYIGSSLVPQLLNAGYHVRVLDAMIFGDDALSAVRDHDHLELVPGDFRHVEHVVGALQGVDAVVHLGAIVGDPACNLDEGLTIDVNLCATQMIAALAKAMRIRRFIFASTCSVYGACDEILDEKSMVKPISLYGHTKLASEQLLMKLADSDFAPTILRFATIYGFSGRTRFDLVVNLLAAKAKMDGEITVHGGNQWRPFVHVADAAYAVLKAVAAPLELVNAQVFNVGSNDQNYTISQIGEMVHEQVMSARLVVRHDATDARNYRVDFSKISRLLNYQPRWTVSQGIEQVLESIASGEVTDYRDPRYSNVSYLTQSGTAHLERNTWAHELIRKAAL
jgi:nucleoside-diphosphate-sugar epimerase